MKGSTLIFLFSIATNFLYAATFSEHSVQRLDGSDIQFYINRPKVKYPVPLLLIIQGSSCRSIYPAALDAGNFSDQSKLARIDVEKFNLNKNTKDCPQSYLNNNSIDQRIADYLRVMHFIRRNANTWWNGKLLIAGGSEGGVIAPILATYIQETSKLAIMAGGTGWTMREEMLYLLEDSLRSSGANERTITLELGKMSSIFDEAITNPTSSKVYAGSMNTYKWWNSILHLRPRNFMASLDIPILMIHGDADIATPVESARTTAVVFKSLGKMNLKYIEYPGLDHHWDDRSGKSHAPKVIGDVLKWLSAP